MYALHDAGLAISALPTPQVTVGATDQLERRAVEATERGSLTTNDRHNIMYSSTAAVLQLVENSAENYAEMLAIFEASASVAPADVASSVSAGQNLDVYA
jgi:hypothetical protein